MNKLVLLFFMFCLSSWVKGACFDLDQGFDKKYIIYNDIVLSINKGDTISIEYSSKSNFESKKIKKGKVEKYKEETYVMQNFFYSYGPLSTNSVSNQITNNYFNRSLAKDGFSDSTKQTHHNFNNTIIISPKIKQYTIHSKIGAQGWYVIEMGIDWIIYNYYMEPLDSIYISSSSDYFNNIDLYKTSSQNQADYNKAVGNYYVGPYLEITEKNYLELFKNQIFEKLLVKTDKITENDFSLAIKKSQETPNGSNLNAFIQSGVTISTKNGHGSGFIISEDGYIISNYHVIANSKNNLKIIMNNGKKYDSKIIYTSPEVDLALLKIDESNLIPLTISSDTNNILGKEVIAIGTPKDIKLGQTVSKGIVSGYRNIEDIDYIQTDVSINSGNSGGALIDKNGFVIGVVTAKYFGIGIEGIGFALPSKYIFSVLGINYTEK